MGQSSSDSSSSSGSSSSSSSSRSSSSSTSTGNRLIFSSCKKLRPRRNISFCLLLSLFLNLFFDSSTGFQTPLKMTLGR